MIERQRAQELWIAWARLFAVGFAGLQVVLVAHDDPAQSVVPGLVVTAVLAVGAVAFPVLARLDLSSREMSALGAVALVFDTAVLWAYVLTHSFASPSSGGTPSTRLILLAVIEAAVRYGVAGGVGLTLANIPLLVVAESTRPNAVGGFEIRSVTLSIGVQLITGVVVGGLTQQLHRESSRAEARATEAEHLHEEIGRYAARLELANRAAQALASSLDMQESFKLFVRELRKSLPFDRIALILSERDDATVAAEEGASVTSGPSVWSRPLEETALGEVMRTGQTQVRHDLTEGPRLAEEEDLAAIGMRARVVVPLTVGGNPLGVLSISRREPGSFTPEEVDLLTFLGRQVATAIENIRAFEAERAAAEELRRLSALRADFVSLVTHELRGPMASVVGCAATLRQRWRTLTFDQRESFLGLIEEETSRLASLVGDVLDTSRLEAGTFTYSFADVDMEAVVREVAGFVDLGNEEVAIRTEVAGPLPPIRGDRERLRQVVMNLLTNAVKYTEPGDEVEVGAALENGSLAVSVRDHGPGISKEEQRLIFEKFRRAGTGHSTKPGAGLGLFIARSITEAHGGTIEVESEPGEGATFVVRLPLSADG
jgi:signal transduction histidine kinase